MTDAITPGPPPLPLDFEQEVTLRVRVRMTEEGRAAIERYVGLPEGNEYYFTPNATREQVVLGVIQTAVYTGRDDLSSCDGYADLPAGALQVHTIDITEYP